jgi:23S rRNA (adenine-N6)-dimethyltransferase
VGTRARPPRTWDPRPSGRHLLRSRRIAGELVDQAGVSTDDDVLEIGAGSGRITAALARRARRVIAVELAPDLARGLRQSFGTEPTVEVVEADVLQVSRPVEPFRAFGNVPFSLSTSILRWLLDDPSSPLVRADLLLRYEVARKRASLWPGRLLTLGWLPWWEFALVRRISKRCFEPSPSVDAGMLRITRRDPPMLPHDERSAFVRMLRASFRHSGDPVRSSFPGGLTADAWKRMARERGIPLGAAPSELDVFDWVDLFRVRTLAGRSG